MKMWILAMTMTFAVAANAQDKKMQRSHFTPEQRAELQSKKMTLALDLNEKQQKDVRELMIEKGKARAEYRRQHMAERQNAKKLTSDDRFAMKSKMLDDRIAMRNDMKKILSKEQFEKLEKMQSKKPRHTAKRKQAKRLNKR